MAVQLYFFPTPNGRKVSIALEEMNLAYEIRMVDIFKLQQTDPEYLRINPNARIPGLVDPDVEGEPVVIFESGAMLQYLGRKSRRFYPVAEAQRSWVDAWVFWQMAGLGPMTGQLTWFKRANSKPGRDPRDCSLALHRYEKEMRRLYNVLEGRLADRQFICDEYSIADMACWPWVNQHHDYLGDLRQFPNIFSWHERIGARPAVLRGMQAGAAAPPE
jgi:GSH-dependent disulfide-bond oxidoreductase